MILGAMGIRMFRGYVTLVLSCRISMCACLVVFLYLIFFFLSCWFLIEIL